MSIRLSFELGSPISNNQNVLCYNLHESTVGQGNCSTIDLSLDQANLHFNFEKLQNELHGDLKLYSEVKIWGQSDLATFIAKLFFSGACGYEKVVLESDWKTVISKLSKPHTCLTQIEEVLKTENLLRLGLDMKISHIHWEGNHFADWLAGNHDNFPLGITNFSFPPNGLIGHAIFLTFSALCLSHVCWA